MRYALISFLNARPLWWGLVRGPAREGETFEFTSPARCADRLSDGTSDLGLIPAIEMMRIPGLVGVPGICIASASEVRSVLLVSRVPFDEIRSVALDPSSRTSVSLARILLGERLGPELYSRIKFDPLERRDASALEGHDSVVVIGDPALQLSRAGFAFRYDLASEWNRMFGEPFVFAFWAGRRDALERAGAAAVTARLAESRAFGMQQIETIAREASEELALPFGELVDYFRDALHYHMGDRERAALRRFYSLAEKYGLIERAKEIEWLGESQRF